MGWSHQGTPDGVFVFMKKSFLIHLDSLEILDELSDEQIGKLLKAFRSYHLGLEPKLDQILRIAFKPFQLQFDRDSEKYKETSERNSLNGSKGGRPKKQKNPVAFSGLSENQSKAKKADNDSDSDNDNVSENDTNKKSKSKQFIAPSYEEVKAYFIENNESLNNLDRCFHHYADHGWTNSHGKKVKDWKRTIKTNWFGKNQNNATTYVPPATKSRNVHESFQFKP